MIWICIYRGEKQSLLQQSLVGISHSKLICYLRLTRQGAINALAMREYKKDRIDGNQSKS